MDPRPIVSTPQRRPPPWHRTLERWQSRALSAVGGYEAPYPVYGPDDSDGAWDGERTSPAIARYLPWDFGVDRLRLSLRPRRSWEEVTEQSDIARELSDVFEGDWKPAGSMSESHQLRLTFPGGWLLAHRRGRHRPRTGHPGSGQLIVVVTRHPASERALVSPEHIADVLRRVDAVASILTGVITRIDTAFDLPGLSHDFAMLSPKAHSQTFQNTRGQGVWVGSPGNSKGRLYTPLGAETARMEDEARRCIDVHMRRLTIPTLGDLDAGWRKRLHVRKSDLTPEDQQVVREIEARGWERVMVEDFRGRHEDFQRLKGRLRDAARRFRPKPEHIFRACYPRLAQRIQQLIHQGT
jgi:hypothetical protein